MQMLRRADTNDDGKVDWDEFVAAVPNASKDRFESLDRNKDGVLDSADRPGPGQGGPGRGGPGAGMMARLKQADTNGDGKVSLEEAKAAFPNMPEERFKALDRNGDGVICPKDRDVPAK